ncbi:zinc finger protein OZF-like isoform X2 [Plodia interpunctella]|uniref:zinc finger protein OZF-like isoform X2 n=1 Tax=Plodia interpunctella TaxID=58824 RepID=UPI002368E679|nr:zinc finger protein OZF-like isoform X2 [Plodia interpunctella]
MQLSHLYEDILQIELALKYLNDQKSLIDLKSLLVKLFVMNENTDSVKMKQELCIGLEKNHQTDDGVVKTEPVIDIPGRVKVEPETDANDAVVKIELKSEVDITNTVNVKTEESPCPEVGSFNVYDIKFEIDEGSPTVVKHKDCDMEDVASAQTSDAGKRKQVTGSTNDRKHRNPRLETTTRTGPHECNVCQRQFAQNSDLKRHYRIHTGEKPYQCEVCLSRFSSKHTLSMHYRIHTGEKPFECEVCQRKFSCKSTLTTHKRTHTGEKLFHCEDCQKTFTRKSDLLKHFRIHTDVASAQTSDAGKRKQIETTLDRKQRKPQQESTRTVQGPHECNVCQRRFNRNGYLLEHLRTHTGEKPFECEVCQRRFSKKTNLLSHIRIHTGEKPFPCDICHMRFSKKTNLLTHIITHTGNKPFRCDVCQKRFSLKVNLISHSRTHTGEKPFKCEVCQKCFRYKARFLSHIRSYSCEQEIVIC